MKNDQVKMFLIEIKKFQNTTRRRQENHFQTINWLKFKEKGYPIARRTIAKKIQRTTLIFLCMRMRKIR
jgi:hypothetical protein